MNNLPPKWDERQKRLGASILQSAGWAEFQQTLGRKVFYDHNQDWSWVGFERKSKGLRYLMIPYGPTIRANKNACFDSVLKTAVENRFDFVRIEPIGKVNSEDLKKLNAKQVPELDPQYTQLINLNMTEAELRSSLRSGHRNPINTAEKRGVEVYQSYNTKELTDFLKLIDQTAKRAGIKNYSDEYYRKLIEVLFPKNIASFYVAKYQKKKVSISIVYDWNGTRYYAWAGNDQELNRKSQASVVSVWRMILDAKHSGMHTFDLWGVAPQNAPQNHKWVGISNFKRGFGGDTIGTIGTWDIPIKKIKYKAYEIYKKARG